MEHTGRWTHTGELVPARGYLTMGNGTQRLVWWILGTLLVITVSLSSTLFGMIQADIERIEQRQATIEDKIDEIQAQYYRIAVIESQLEELLNNIR